MIKSSPVKSRRNPCCASTKLTMSPLQSKTSTKNSLQWTLQPANPKPPSKKLIVRNNRAIVRRGRFKRTKKPCRSRTSVPSRDMLHRGEERWSMFLTKAMSRIVTEADQQRKAKPRAKSQACRKVALLSDSPRRYSSLCLTKKMMDRAARQTKTFPT